MKNFYFDLCAIPIYILIMYTYFDRRMTRFPSFNLFFVMDIMSLTCAILDVWMEYVVNPVPLSPFNVALGMFISFAYKLLRNSSMVLYLIFIFMFTKTDYRIRSTLNRIILWAPNAILVVLLILNFFNGAVFTVTAQNGYARGPLLMVFYVVAFVYGIAGIIYCCFCKKYLDTGKWLSLISVYILTAIAVVIQMLIPNLLVEMFSTAVGLLMVVLLVMRPEESIDINVGVQTYKTFERDMRNVVLAKENVTLLSFHMPYALDNRNYLGDSKYSEYVTDVVDTIQENLKENKCDYEIYYEHPENIYVVLSDDVNAEEIASSCISRINNHLRYFKHSDVWFDIQVCLINCPKDLNGAKEIIDLCHRFPSLVSHSTKLIKAEEIINSRDYEIQNHIEEIINKAINEDRLEIYYQPIYDVRDGRFHSAEALARINDQKYGLISPALFIPAAEKNGLIIPLGKKIIEKVFRFIAGNDIKKIGLDYIEINLSVAQCLQYSLPETIIELQNKYGIMPELINFEITESMLSSIENVMERNLLKLSKLGYSFTLDDYGIGYSNIQRLRKLPLQLIKIDKSMVDDVFTDDGGVIMKNTVRMMQDINKKLVMEGAETKETVELLKDLACEYIQGFYFSRPLPEKEFLNFISQNNLLSA